MNLSRRGFLKATTTTAAVAAVGPWVVKAESIMKIWVPPTVLILPDNVQDGLIVPDENKLIIEKPSMVNFTIAGLAKGDRVVAIDYATGRTLFDVAVPNGRLEKSLMYAPSRDVGIVITNKNKSLLPFRTKKTVSASNDIYMRVARYPDCNYLADNREPRFARLDISRLIPNPQRR